MEYHFEQLYIQLEWCLWLSIMVDTDRDGIANSYDGDDDSAVSDILDIATTR